MSTLRVNNITDISSVPNYQRLSTITSVSYTPGQTYIELTGIPTWASLVTVLLRGISTNSTAVPSDNLLLQIGPSTGVITTGYTSGVQTISEGSNSNTTGFQLLSGSGVFVGGSIVYGDIRLRNVSGNTWHSSSTVASTASNIGSVGGGEVTLSADLERIRLTTVGFVGLFDAGSISVICEGNA